MDTFSYAPLFDLLEKFDMTFYDLRKQCKLADSTVLKIISNKPIMISSIAKICLYLGVEYSDVVSINYDYLLDKK